MKIQRPSRRQKPQLKAPARRLIQTRYGELPVVGTLTQCENTDRGWQFLDENGVLCEFVHPPERGIARIPVEGYVFSATKGKPVGVLLLELKSNQAA